MSRVLEIEGLNFAYAGQHLVLENIELQVAAGEFLGIIGPNGGGKTTLLKLILGLLQPNAGSVRILNNRSSGIGYVPQFSTFELDFPIIVRDVVLMGRLGITKARFGYGKADILAAQQVLEQLEIAELWAQPIGTLSGGQLQRVMVARALVCKPQLLLLDEPTANVDVRAEKNIFDILQGINNEVAIVVVSHDLGFISQYVKRVACLNRTLVCHDTYEITPQLIQQTYGSAVRIIKHE